MSSTFAFSPHYIRGPHRRPSLHLGGAGVFCLECVRAHMVVAAWGTAGMEAVPTHKLAPSPDIAPRPLRPARYEK